MSKGYIMTSSNKCVQGGNRGNISTEETPPLTHCILVSCLLQAMGAIKIMLVYIVRSVCKVSQIAARGRSLCMCPAGDRACRIQYSCTSQPRCRLT